MSYLYIALTIIFTVYGQLIIKWQVAQSGSLPSGGYQKLYFLLQLVLNPWIVTGFIAAFLASLAWMAAMTKFQLSHAYPFMSLAFIMVLFLSGIFFHEVISWQKITGMILIVVGIIVSSQG